MNPVELVCILPALYLTLISGVHTGAGVETVYIVSPLPYSSYVFTYLKFTIQSEQTYSTSPM